jgi:hypothetical protein
MLDFRRVVKNRKIQPEAAFCPTKNQGLEWMNSNPRMQIAFCYYPWKSSGLQEPESSRGLQP